MIDAPHAKTEISTTQNFVGTRVGTDRVCLILFFVITLGSLFLDITPIAFVVGAAVFGILITGIRARKGGGAA